jgi:response regulator RpfG family c-di-GMP phosphodiesterase
LSRLADTEPTDMQKKTVMICDDEPDILTIYSNFLKRKYTIITANSGQTCIEKYKDNRLKGKKIDVLLVDYRLGDMLGDAVACQIRDLDSTKSLLITAYDLDEKLLDDIKSKGCIVGQLKKPLSLASLAENIDSLMAQS